MSSTTQHSPSPGATIAADPRTTKLPRLFSLRFSTRALSNAAAAIVLMQLTFYSTEVVGLPSVVVGGLFLASRVIDAITDLIIGGIVDRTNSRWGKARPWELAVIPMWIGMVALFSTPDMGEVWTVIYLFVCFFMVTSVTQTVLSVTEGVYLRRALRGETKYAKVISRQAVVMILGATGLSVALPQMIAAWGDEPGGWTRISLVIGVPMMLLGLVRMLTVKELPLDASATPIVPPSGLFHGIKTALRNKYVWLSASMFLCASAASAMPGTAGTYFFLYVFGDIGLGSLTAFGTLLVPFVLLMFPSASRRIGGMAFIRITLIVAIAGFTSVSLFSHSIVIVVIGSTLGAMSSAMTAMIGFFSIQAMTYGEWRTGIRIEAGVNAVTGFCGKLGNGLPPMLVGAGLAVAGYVSGADSQPESVPAMAAALMGYVPALLCAAMLAISFFWKLDKELPTIQQDLAEGRTSASSTAEPSRTA